MRNLLSGTDPVVRVTGKELQVISQAALTQSIAINPANLGTRLAAFLSLYQEFRFTRMTVKLHTAAQNYAVGYSKVVGLTVSALADVYQLTSSRFLAATDTVPQTLALGPNVLKHGLREWYSCEFVGTVADSDQGTLAIATTSTTATVPVVLEIGYCVEFRGPTNPTSL